MPKVKDNPGPVWSESEWQQFAKKLVKDKLEKARLSHKDLSDKLRELDIEESGTQINRKLNRGTFSAIFLLQCLTALDVAVLRLREPRSRKKAPSSTPHVPVRTPRMTSPIDNWGQNVKKR